MSKLKQYFDELWIREVPMGVPLTPDNADSFPLRFSGSYRSEDGYLISPEIEEGKYSLLPPDNDFMNLYYTYPDLDKLRDTTLDECVRHYLKITGNGDA